MTVSTLCVFFGGGCVHVARWSVVVWMISCGVVLGFANYSCGVVLGLADYSCGVGSSLIVCVVHRLRSSCHNACIA